MGFDISDQVVYVENHLRKGRVSGVHSMGKLNNSWLEQSETTVIYSVNYLNLPEFFDEVQNVVPVHYEALVILVSKAFVILLFLIHPKKLQVSSQPLSYVVFLLIMNNLIV